MTEKQLNKLGFTKNEEPGDEGFYYYTFNLGHICLITQADDEVPCHNGWHAYSFDDERLRFNDYKTTKKFIKLLKQNFYGNKEKDS